MGQLHDRMEQDLKLRKLSPATVRNYLLYCRKFAAFYMRSPEELGARDVVSGGGLLQLAQQTGRVAGERMLLPAAYGFQRPACGGG